MNKEERHLQILNQLERKQKIWVVDLAGALDVTPETIRRDFAELEINEQLTRIHGGAIPFIQTQKEMIFEKKMSVNIDKKKKIAKKAAELIQHEETIAVDVGTTTVHIADMLNNIHGLTIVTNSLSAASRFNLAIEEQRITGQVIMLPGITNPYQTSVKGAYTVEFLKRFNFTRAFISCGGVTNFSIYDFDMDEALVSEVMIQCSQESILLADAYKLDKKSFFKIAPLKNVSKVICDVLKPSHWEENGCEWITVEQTVKHRNPDSDSSGSEGGN